MPTKSGHILLTQAERLEVVRQIACYEGEKRIAQYLESIGKPSLDIDGFCKYYKRSDKYRPLIEKIRAQYNAGLGDISVASKRFRLQRYEAMHEKLYEEGKYELAAKMLERAQGETEGKYADGRPNIFITQFNQMTDSEIEQRKLKILNAIERLKNRQKQQLEAGGYEELRAEEAQQAEAEIMDAEVIDETDDNAR